MKTKDFCARSIKGFVLIVIHTVQARANLEQSQTAGRQYLNLCRPRSEFAHHCFKFMSILINIDADLDSCARLVIRINRSPSLALISQKGWHLGNQGRCLILNK